MTAENPKPTITQPVMTPASKPGRFPLAKYLSRKVLIGAGVVVLIAIIAVGAVLWSHRIVTVTKPLDKNGQPIFQQSFSKVNKFILTGAAGNDGVTFNMPTEFGSKTTAKGETSFNETTSNASGQEVPLAELAVASFGVTHPQTQAQLAYLGKVMASSSTNQHAVAPLSSYIAAHMPDGYTVKMGAVKSFRNASIKSNAWAIAATATATDSKNKNLGAQQGQLVYAISGKGYYYFVVMATDYNWTKNPDAWQAVFNSLSIDQKS